MEKMKKANNQDKFKALRLAEIKLTDQEDYKNCVKDMTKTASLNKEEAKVVANAIRSKYLPNILREAGFEEVDVKPMVKTDSEAEETTDFADDENEDDMEEMHHFEDGEEDLDEDNEEDFDEEDDNETAKFEIEVPADMVDAAQKAVQEALDNLLGGEDDMDMDEDMDDDMDSEEDEMDEDMDDDIDMEEDEEEEDSEPKMHTSSIGVNKMTKQALAARRAQREAILKKVASEEEKYPASGTFKYNEDLVNMEGEVDYPSMTMEGSEGNSLKEQNPTWAEQKVPTNNADSLQFPDVTKPMKFEGSGDGSLEYTVDWDSLENPSEGLEDVNLFEVPTQMPSMPHKTTIPNARVASTEKIAVQCTTCGHTMEMSEEEMNSEDTKCPGCEGKEEEDVEAVTDITTQPGGQLKMHVSSLDTARIKTAYSCSSKLALAGIIESSDIDSYAEQMLNDELKADAMIRQTKLLLSAAQASTERVAAAAAERMSVRTASSNGISTSPAFTSSSAANSAALDIQSALKGAFTMPTIED
jgi:hypothetical protein